MYPAALSTVSTCVGCGDQSRSISIVNLTDTLFAGTPAGDITVYLDANQIISIAGVPAGVTYGTDLGAGPNAMGIWYNTGAAPNQIGAQGCIYFNGTEAVWNAAVNGGPNNDGIYPLTITMDARINSTSPDVTFVVPNGSWMSTVDPGIGGGAIVNTSYQLVVDGNGIVTVQECSFDAQYAAQGAGSYPAALSTVSTCVGCGDQSRSISIVNLTDTFTVAQPIGIITLYIDANQIVSIAGVPAGVTYGTDLGAGPSAMGIWYNTGAVPNQTGEQGCVYFNGTEAVWNAAVNGGPNNDGIYPLTITMDARINSTSPDVSFVVPNGSWMSTVDPGIGGGAIVNTSYQLVVVADGIVGVQERAAAFGAYPNPAATALRFNMGNVTQAFVALFDLSGQRVASASLVGSGASLALDGVANGMYIYRLTDTNGNLLGTNRVAVVH